MRRVIDPQTKDEALRLLQAGISVADVAQETGIAVATLYHYKSDLKNGSLTAPPPTPVASEAKASPEDTPEPTPKEQPAVVFGAREAAHLAQEVAQHTGGKPEAFRVYAGDTVLGTVAVSPSAPGEVKSAPEVSQARKPIPPQSDHIEPDPVLSAEDAATRHAEYVTAVKGGVNARTRASEPTFRIILDPESAQKAFADAAKAWIDTHFTTHFDGQTVHVDLPPIPTRWVVQAQAITMAPEEES